MPTTTRGRSAGCVREGRDGRRDGRGCPERAEEGAAEGETEKERSSSLVAARPRGLDVREIKRIGNGKALLLALDPALRRAQSLARRFNANGGRRGVAGVRDLGVFLVVVSLSAAIISPVKSGGRPCSAETGRSRGRCALDGCRGCRHTRDTTPFPRPWGFVLCNVELVRARQRGGRFVFPCQQYNKNRDTTQQAIDSSESVGFYDTWDRLRCNAKAVVSQKWLVI